MSYLVLIIAHNGVIFEFVFFCDDGDDAYGYYTCIRAVVNDCSAYSFVLYDIVCCKPEPYANGLDQKPKYLFVHIHCKRLTCSVLCDSIIGIAQPP